MNGNEILELEMDGENDAGAESIRGYLKALLEELFMNGEGFSGKRPFGNSGWEYELYTPLLKAGLVGGKFDGDGYLESVDEEAAVKLIYKAIEAL